jgi:hypothetical protein
MPKFIAFLVLIMSFSVYAAEESRVIEVESEAHIILKPDLAHLVLKISGVGDNYKKSTENAKFKIEEMKEIVKEIVGTIPEVKELKRENKPQGMLDGDMMEYQKEYFSNMAKAMKGEDITVDEATKKQVMTTNILVYFTLTSFSDESILDLKSRLAEKEIAFDKESLFDFTSGFSIKTSSILFGIKEPSNYLGELASEAFDTARKKAAIIAAASDQKLGDLFRISGCGDDLEGTVSISDINTLVGKDLGPLSTDPNRLVIRYKKKYKFLIE